MRDGSRGWAWAVRLASLELGSAASGNSEPFPPWTLTGWGRSIFKNSSGGGFRMDILLSKPFSPGRRILPARETTSRGNQPIRRLEDMLKKMVGFLGPRLPHVTSVGRDALGDSDRCLPQVRCARSEKLIPRRHALRPQRRRTALPIHSFADFFSRQLGSARSPDIGIVHINI